MDYKEFSSKIKEKYPQYKDMDDEDLAKRMIEKYSQYKDVTFEKPTVETPKKETGISDLSLSQLGDVAKESAKAIGKEVFIEPTKALGKGILRGATFGTMGKEEPSKIDYGLRSDGTPKGSGFLGELKRPDGKVSTELSIGVNIDGKETEIPSLVPTLTKQEINYLLEGNKPTSLIVQKAINHAKSRIAEGKSVFAESGELPNLSGSVMETPRQKFLRRIGKAGEFAGMAVPLVASEMTGGAALGGAAAMRGAGSIAVPVAEAVGTGLTFESAKGAAQNKNITDTAQDMAKGGVTFAGLGLGGQALGWLRKILGEEVADSLANHFINTNSKIAEKLVEQGRPSLGKQALGETPELFGIKSRKQVFDEAGKNLNRLENQIQGKLDSVTEKMKTPNVSGTEIKGVPILSYSPTKNIINEPSEAIFPSGQRVNLPAKEFQTEGGATFSKEVPEIEQKQAEYVKQAQRENINRFKERMNQPKYGLKVQREGTISINDIAKPLDELKKSYQTGTRIGEVAKINRLKSSFVSENPEVLDKNSAMILKRRLDDRVSKSYLAPSDAKTALSTEVDEALANELRKQIYKIDPELGQLAAQESLLIRLRTGLKPVVAKKGSGRIADNLYSSIANAIGGSRATSLATKALSKTMGKPNPFISNISRQGSRALSQEMLPDYLR